MNYTTEIVKFFDDEILLFHFEDGFNTLDTFFATDVPQFHSILVREINRILARKKEEGCFTFNSCDITIRKEKCVVASLHTADVCTCCEIPTEELLSLIKQWVRMDNDLKSTK